MTPTATFHALADPTRAAMVAQLTHGPATVGALGAAHQLSKPAITKHVAVLDRAGLIAKERRGREVLCTLRLEPLREAEDWLHDRRAYWESTLDRLTDLVEDS